MSANIEYDNVIVSVLTAIGTVILVTMSKLPAFPTDRQHYTEVLLHPDLPLACQRSFQKGGEVFRVVLELLQFLRHQNSILLRQFLECLLDIRRRAEVQRRHFNPRT